ncbi:SDR family NAD(P)-dependent oxidoreductase [Sphingobacterium siyangense]|uniref:NAD(P)-dependent dehydrogenase (Short-subunit alcohol dehydrogenase family) n=1 Tax=Sphingobacterium siyangense TaxID=459529 RepID=A0A562MJE0_9SPHI|nr:SDR family oxidoreductase [Sphingobacterium siyangense]TWI19970.1 NAD(P)-dependent dehydrogenase (short-subunit alcohol dehydrogenase family) [Sphingobacterium siyangense]
MSIKKNILITGATSGIGKALACLLVKDLNTCVYGIGRDEEKIQDLLGYENFIFLKFDLFKVEEIEELFKSSLGDIKFSGFVHCAGLEETLPIGLYTVDRVQQVFTVNVFSAIEIVRNLSKKKYSLDQASFILLSSVMGELGQPGKIGYCASKSALLGFARSLALELAKRKIRVNCVSPGIVDTPLTQKLFQQIEEENKSRIVGMHPIGIGEPNDVVYLIEYLLGDKSKWLTGQNIKIDGGYSIQ